MKTLKKYTPYKVKDKDGKIKKDCSIIIPMSDIKIKDVIYKKYSESTFEER